MISKCYNSIRYRPINIALPPQIVYNVVSVNYLLKHNTNTIDPKKIPLCAQRISETFGKKYHAINDTPTILIAALTSAIIFFCG